VGVVDRMAAIAIALSVAAVVGCGQVRLGGFPRDSGVSVNDSGVPIKPRAALDWEPKTETAGSNVTAVFYGKKYLLVGFTDGEIYASPVLPTPTWSRLDLSTQPNVRTLPHRPVSAFLVDEDAGLGHLGVGYVGAPLHHTIWVRFDETSDWYDTGPPETAEDVLAFSVSPFDTRQVLAVVTSGVVTSTDGGMTWGPAWPDRAFPGPVNAIAEGRSPDQLRRAWLGLSTGQIYYADANSDGTWPASPTWTPMTSAFPARPVSAISVNPVEPAEIWISFRFINGDGGGVWRTSDYGRDWVNVDNDRLPKTTYSIMNSGFGAVAVDPMLRIAYLTVMSGATDGSGSVIGYWSTDSGMNWYVTTAAR
jgi:hypothetical protein